MILLAEKLSNSEVVHFGVMGIEVKRNAYGRQLGSFETLGDFKGIDKKVKMVFIRAPYVENIKEGAEVLSVVNGNITAVREKICWLYLSIQSLQMILLYMNIFWIL